MLAGVSLDADVRSLCFALPSALCLWFSLCHYGLIRKAHHAGISFCDLMSSKMDSLLSGSGTARAIGDLSDRWYPSPPNPQGGLWPEITRLFPKVL